MGSQRGRNSGITGSVDIPGFGAKFEVRLYGFKEALDASVLNAAGRGDADDFPEQWFIGAGGSLACFGEAKAGWIFPSTWKGEQGTITLQLDTGKTQIVPVKVTGLKLDFDEKTDDSTWDFALICRITDNPTLAGFSGSQPAAASETHADKQLFEGLTKSLDPDGLETAAGQRYAVYGLANSDSAERTAITTIIAAAVTPPLPDLKPRIGGLTRASYRLAYVTVSWALTTTAEDVINAATSELADDKDNATTATMAAFDAEPPEPTYAQDTVVRTKTYKVFNDGKTLISADRGMRDTDDDTEMLETSARIDTIWGIKSSGQDANLFLTLDGEPADATPPDPSLKVVGKTVTQVNRKKSKKVTYYDVNDSAEEIIFGRAKSVTDSTFQIKSHVIKGAVHDTGSVPAEPGASGLVLINTETAEIVSPDTSNQSVTFWLYGETTAANDVTFEHTKYVLDIDGLESSQLIAVILDGGSPPPVPTPEDPLKFYGSTDIPLTNADASNLKLRIYRFELVTSAEKIERDGSGAEVDPNHLASKAQETTIYDDGGSPPTDFVNVATPTDTEIDEVDDKQLNDGKWQRVIKKVTNNTKNIWERLKKLVTTDVGHVGQAARIVKVLTTGTAVAADDTYNTDSTNLEFAQCEVTPISSTQSAYIYTFEPLSPKNKIINEDTVTQSDPVSFLVGAASKGQVTANSTESDPGFSGRVCVKYTVRKIGRALYRHRWDYAFRSLAAQIIADKTTTTVDGSFLESEAVTGEVYLISTGPAGAGSAPFTNAINISYTDVEIENPLYRARLYKWSLTSEANKRIYAASGAKADPLEIFEFTQASIVANNTDNEKTIAIAANQTNKADLQFVEAQVKRLNTQYVLKVLVFTGEDNKRHSYSVHYQLDSFRGKPAAGFDVAAGWGDPDAYVKVVAPGIISGGPAGFDYGDIEMIYWQRTITFFKVRRRFITTTARQPQDFEFRTSQHCSNDAVFLGYPKHQVLFVGAEIIYNGTNNDNHLVVVDLCYKVDTLMHMIDGYLPTPGTHYTYAAGTITASGFYDPDTAFSSGAGVYYMEWPAEASFTGMGVL